MKQYKKLNFLMLVLIVGTLLFTACTKYGSGFLSPNIQYASNQFTIIRGRVAASYSLTTDGSSIPLSIKWTHIYDSTGKIVDTIFQKKYPVPVWTAAYNPLTDTTYATITAKRGVQNLTPITVNEANGTIESNSATIYVPVGSYTMDLAVKNSAGTEALKKIVQIVIVDGKNVETAPETGTFRNQLLPAGTSAAGADLFNAVNNPFDDYTITRFADTPNVFILKVTDRNGVPFNPKTGEFTKRPNTGLNPIPPFLQNLQDYAPDTFVANDTAISLKYPLVPFPINSLGNGYNMYYRIPTQYIGQFDSTSSWSSNIAGNFYKGSADSHYKGVFTNGKYDALLRIPLRIQVPGAYQLTIKILNLTHK